MSQRPHQDTLSEESLLASACQGCARGGEPQTARANGFRPPTAASKDTTKKSRLARELGSLPGLGQLQDQLPQPLRFARAYRGAKADAVSGKLSMLHRTKQM